ncbi:pilus assembly FimT family protein [Chengkuizengella axinellae]|uniref:Type II secretion system protein n=1 Tax=Chengkuizengella axinellae TaxID=3064388 RepID=A0ABT9IYA7_9BACL|nr:type II secretion system protein [Chengkuizengella sp. 2205SS18-9]MDP5274302.1 type II secretion system protein [Chengkuizengella sp. 2205SS18-9]
MIKKMKNMFKQEKGLTLIELLAVIVVLGIIAAIAVPSINGIINDTKEQAREAIAIQIYESARIHSTIHNLPEQEIELSTLISTADDVRYFEAGDLVDPVTGGQIEATSKVDFGERDASTNTDGNSVVLVITGVSDPVEYEFSELGL